MVTSLVIIIVKSWNSQVRMLAAYLSLNTALEPWESLLFHSLEMKAYPTKMASLLISNTFLSANDGSIKFSTHGTFGWRRASAYQMADVLLHVPDQFMAPNLLHIAMECCLSFISSFAFLNIAVCSRILMMSLFVIAYCLPTRSKHTNPHFPLLPCLMKIEPLSTLFEH
jgi:hypothetical protein